MVQPNAYPALSIRPPQHPDIVGRGMQMLGFAQDYQAGQLRNQMMEAGMKREEDLRNVRGRLFGGGGAAPGGPAGGAGGAGEIMPGEHAESNRRAMMQYGAIDPEGAHQMYKFVSAMDKDKRDKLQDQAIQLATMGDAVLKSSPMQMPLMYAEMVKQAKAIGVEGLPPTWSEDVLPYLGIKIAQAKGFRGVREAIDEEELKAQSTLGKLEIDRRKGLLDEGTYQAAKADALRSPDERTSLQKDTAFVMETLGMSKAEAVKFARQAQGKSRDAFRQSIFERSLSGGYNSPEEAQKIADEATGYFFEGDEFKPKAEVKEEDKGLLARATEAIGGAMGFGGGEAVATGEAAATGRETAYFNPEGNRTKQITEMDPGSLRKLVFDPKFMSGLTESERELIDKRLDE